MSAECVHMWAPSILDPESIEHEVELSNTTPHNVIKPLQSLFMRTHAHSECGLRSAEAFPLKAAGVQSSLVVERPPLWAAAETNFNLLLLMGKN